MNANRLILSYFAQFFLEWEMLRTKIVKKLKTHILCSIIVFFKLRCLLHNVQKYGAGQAPDHSMAHAHCMLDT